MDIRQEIREEGIIFCKKGIQNEFGGLSDIVTTRRFATKRISDLNPLFTNTLTDVS